MRLNPRILNKEVQLFLDQHLHSELDRLIFQGSPFEEVSVQELAEQIQSRRKCRVKLPLWWSTPGIVYPHPVSIEQSSSERAARYKAGLVQGKQMIDLTGGYGVDAYFFSRNFEQVTHVESDRSLHEIAKHNMQMLNAENVECVFGDSIEFLRSTQENYDLIYVDPSRRGNHKERVFRLEDCSPDLTVILDLLLSRCDRLLVKLAPFIDISHALGQLRNVEEVHVVAIDNEVKELLFLVAESSVEAPVVKAVHLFKDQIDILEKRSELDFEIQYGPVKSFLFEPNAAIRKAGIYASLAQQLKLEKLHPNSHLFTGDALIDFPGRTFRVRKQLAYRPKKLRKELGLNQAHITTRNFRESVASIRKRTGIKDGGEAYLFFTTDHKGKALVLCCDKVDISET